MYVFRLLSSSGSCGADIAPARVAGHLNTVYCLECINILAGNVVIISMVINYLSA